RSIAGECIRMARRGPRSRGSGSRRSRPRCERVDRIRRHGRSRQRAGQAVFHRRSANASANCFVLQRRLRQVKSHDTGNSKKTDREKAANYPEVTLSGSKSKSKSKSSLVMQQILRLNGPTEKGNCERPISTSISISGKGRIC